jgi:hypothetical protein
MAKENNSLNGFLTSIIGLLVGESGTEAKSTGESYLVRMNEFRESYKIFFTHGLDKTSVRASVRASA